MTVFGLINNTWSASRGDVLYVSFHQKKKKGGPHIVCTFKIIKIKLSPNMQAST